MKQLEQLPEMADRMLGGLKADEGMKQRILAAAEKPAIRQGFAFRTAAVAAACVFAVGIGVFALNRKKAVQEDVPVVYAMSAGDSSAESTTAVSSDDRAMLDLGTSSISVQNKTAVSYHSIWENGGSSFPMIGINGRYYRMLTTPDSVSDAQLGEVLGQVQEYTTEPALAAQNVLMSNTVQSGTQVREIKGMGGAAVAAQVEGRMRAFQRVSFNGMALLGKEKLSDTLQISGRVTCIEVSGVGTVEDRDTCDRLVGILLKNAVYESSGSLNNKQNLVFTLDNGLKLQMLVKDDRVAACGVWSCPEFFEALENAMN